MSPRVLLCLSVFLGCLCLVVDGRTNQTRADEMDKLCDPNTTKTCPCTDTTMSGFQFCCPAKSTFPLFVCVDSPGKICTTNTQVCGASWWRDSQCKDPCTSTGFDYMVTCGSDEPSCVAPKQ